MPEIVPVTVGSFFPIAISIVSLLSFNFSKAIFTFKLLEQNIKNTDNTNISLFNHNLLDGLSDKAPFNLIIIDGPIFKITDKLKKQLAMNGGRLIYIKKIYDNLGKAYKIIRNEDLYSSEYLFDVMSSYQIQEQQEDFKF